LPAGTGDSACFIGGIRGQTSAAGVAVLVDATGKLGTIVSSQRFKADIKPMDKASEAILALKPVTFRYKQEIDSAGTPQFGLVAEDVEKVNPDLVVRDAEGEVYTVRYDAVNAMLLNEFLKERRQIDAQQKQIDALSAGLQKVSAQLEASKPATQVVNNNQ
jgi:Chaperone of endosialidase